jgi:hypothetical protein
MRQNITIKVQIFLILVLFGSITGMSQPLCTWNPEKKSWRFLYPKFPEYLTVISTANMRKVTTSAM